MNIANHSRGWEDPENYLFPSLVKLPLPSIRFTLSITFTDSFPVISPFNESKDVDFASCEHYLMELGLLNPMMKHRVFAKICPFRGSIWLACKNHGHRHRSLVTWNLQILFIEPFCDVLIGKVKLGLRLCVVETWIHWKNIETHEVSSQTRETAQSLTILLYWRLVDTKDSLIQARVTVP